MWSGGEFNDRCGSGEFDVSLVIERVASHSVTLKLNYVWRGFMTLEQALTVVEQLSPGDRLRLIERMVPGIQRSIPEIASPTPKRSLLGFCSDLGTAPSAEEIDEVQKEMWAGFGEGEI